MSVGQIFLPSPRLFRDGNRVYRGPRMASRPCVSNTGRGLKSRWHFLRAFSSSVRGQILALSPWCPWWWDGSHWAFENVMLVSTNVNESPRTLEYLILTPASTSPSAALTGARPISGCMEILLAMESGSRLRSITRHFLLPVEPYCSHITLDKALSSGLGISKGLELDPDYRYLGPNPRGFLYAVGYLSDFIDSNFINFMISITRSWLLERIRVRALI